MMNPSNLGYAEVNWGADLKKIVPVSMPGFWLDTTMNTPYMNQMRMFLNGELNPKSLFFTKQGILKNKAILHLEAIANSSQLTREEKLSTCSFLSSLWFSYLNINPTEKDLQKLNKRN